MKIVNVIAAAALVAVSMPASAFAKDAAPCSCLTSGPAKGQVGSIVAAQGDVLTNGAKNFEAAKVGSPISIGSEISVGAKSAAQISVGTCGLSLAPGSVTRVSAQEGGNICVSSIQTTTTSYGADPQVSSDDTAIVPVASASTPWVPIALFTTVAVTAGVLALTKDSKPASR